MTLQLAALAQQLGIAYTGDDIEIHGVNSLDQAGPSELSFLANPKYIDLLPASSAGAVLVTAEFAQHTQRPLVSANPYLDFARAATLFAKPQGSFSGISEQAHIAPEAVIGTGCTIYPFAYVAPGVTIDQNCTIFPGCYIGENSKIGAGCILYPNVVLMAGTILGKNVIVNPGVVLGSDGFGFAPSPTGLFKIPQLGHTEIGDMVELGANTTIDRATLGTTKVGAGSKIDNLVMLGHNVEVGSHCVVVAQVGISGSTKLGDQVTIAGQAGLSGHLHIGSGSVIGPQAGVTRSLDDGSVVAGTPHLERSTFLRVMAALPKLPELARRVLRLEKRLNGLEQSQVKGESNG